MGDDPAAKARALAAKFSAKLGGGPIVLGGYVNTSASYQPPQFAGANDSQTTGTLTQEEHTGSQAGRQAEWRCR